MSERTMRKAAKEEIMDLKEKINEEIKLAMKARDKTRLNVVRYLKKLFIENDTSTKPTNELDIIISYAKKTKDSLALYPTGSDQHTEITAEVKILSEFLPTQMEEQEVVKIINDIKTKLDTPNMGAIMKELSPQIKGMFDGKRASQLVKDAL
ncbi:MAG: GatB/YqeY domain-containing protein [Halobacteriovoraceae bacterium]|jgi:uncharacterized protein|nr:GatB/YqeY domain-containing protein [Halobacteriovoraceae bacterium]